MSALYPPLLIDLTRFSSQLFQPCKSSHPSPRARQRPGLCPPLGLCAQRATNAKRTCVMTGLARPLLDAHVRTATQLRGPAQASTRKARLPQGSPTRSSKSLSAGRNPESHCAHAYGPPNLSLAPPSPLPPPPRPSLQVRNARRPPLRLQAVHGARLGERRGHLVPRLVAQQRGVVAVAAREAQHAAERVAHAVREALEVVAALQPNGAVYSMFLPSCDTSVRGVAPNGTQRHAPGGGEHMRGAYAVVARGARTSSRKTRRPPQSAAAVSARRAASQWNVPVRSCSPPTGSRQCAS